MVSSLSELASGSGGSDSALYHGFFEHGYASMFVWPQSTFAPPAHERRITARRVYARGKAAVSASAMQEIEP